MCLDVCIYIHVHMYTCIERERERERERESDLPPSSNSPLDSLSGTLARLLLLGRLDRRQGVDHRGEGLYRILSGSLGLRRADTP